MQSDSVESVRPQFLCGLCQRGASSKSERLLEDLARHAVLVSVFDDLADTLFASTFEARVLSRFRYLDVRGVEVVVVSHSERRES